MANWDIPDFNDVVSESEKDALSARIAMASGGKGYDRWMHNDLVERGYNALVVRRICVERADWQAIRLSMKGVDSYVKLGILKAWWDKAHTGERNCTAEIQVGNYLGALRRGGQLDDNNRVRRWR